MDARFGEVQWAESTLRFNASVRGRSEEVWVRLPEAADRPSDDALAVFQAILAGPGLDELEMAVAPSPTVASAIEAFSGTSLRAERGPEPSTFGAARRGHAVSFSGGFDSLAALALLPKGSHLVSMDFGGWFQRETDFFTRFNPNIVSTNFRSAGFDRNSWLFMLAGVVLLRDHLQLGSYTTGAILESTPWNYRSDLRATPGPPELLRALGLFKVNTVNGLTEVATTLLAMRHFPEHIHESLQSLAAPGSGKSVRKQMLMTAIYRQGKASLPTAPVWQTPSNPPLTYGESLADDTLMPYVIQKFGLQVAQTLMTDMPQELIELAESSDLTFYERYHPAFYLDLHPAVKATVLDELLRAGIDPFVESDWRDFRRLTRILRHVHRLPD